MADIYIAGPWFNKEQMDRLEHIKTIISELDLEYFSPKDESQFKQGDDPAIILQTNVLAIQDCTAIVVITDGKDTGTIWEAGYAYALQKPILYVWLTHQPEQKFNLMLGASGAVAMNYDELQQQLGFFCMYDTFDETDNKGKLFYE